MTDIDVVARNELSDLLGGKNPQVGQTSYLVLRATQVIYIPDQTIFTGTLIFGDQGSTLTHVSGDDGRYNTFCGTNCGNANSTGSRNAAYGNQTFQFNTIGYNNTAIGQGALYQQTTGSYNTAIGTDSSNYNNTGSNNVACGVGALEFNLGSYNTGVGLSAFAAGPTPTSITQNVGIGCYSAYNCTGNSNVVIGYAAAYGVASSSAFNYGTIVGFEAGFSNLTTALYATFLGASAGFANTIGAGDTYVGANAGLNQTTGNFNTVVGYNTGLGVTTGGDNTILGAQVTGLAAGLTGAVILATGEGTIRLDYNNTTAGIWTFAQPVKLPVFTIAQLLALTPLVIGMKAFVSDTVGSAAVTYHLQVAGGGGTTVKSPVYCDGTNWFYD